MFQPRAIDSQSRVPYRSSAPGGDGNRPAWSVESSHPLWQRNIGDHLPELARIQAMQFVPRSWGDEARRDAGWPNDGCYAPLNQPEQVQTQSPYLFPPTNY